MRIWHCCGNRDRKATPDFTVWAMLSQSDGRDSFTTAFMFMLMHSHRNLLIRACMKIYPAHSLCLDVSDFLNKFPCAAPPCVLQRKARAQKRSHNLHLKPQLYLPQHHDLLSKHPKQCSQSPASRNSQEVTLILNHTRAREARSVGRRCARMSSGNGKLSKVSSVALIVEEDTQATQR